MDEYGKFVREVSFAPAEDTIGFDAAFAAGRRLVGRNWETK